MVFNVSLDRPRSNSVPSSYVATLFVFLLFIPHPSAPVSNPLPGEPGSPDEIHHLWSASIDPILQGAVHNSDQAYTEGQELLVPLHAAFALREDAWQRALSAHISRSTTNPSALPSVVLSRLEFLYLTSEFLVLAGKNDRLDLIPPGLPEELFTEVRTYWRVAPAWQWDRGPFFGGIRERILWKLNNRKVAKSYYRAVVDDDLFLIGIAADLKAFGGAPEPARQWSGTLNDVLSIAFKMFSQESSWQPGGGWLFQPGVWADHPEYQYVGNRTPQPDIRPLPVRSIASDSSHSMRFAAWLSSLMSAYPPNSHEYRFYENLRSGLEKQFFEKVLIAPSSDQPCYLTSNFMDGSNGVYRWNYSSLGNGSGYGPNQLSGSLLLGWWSLLRTERIHKFYADLAHQFPWSRQCLDFYLGPAPASAPPARDYDAQSPSVRLWHTLVLLSSKL